MKLKHLIPTLILMNIFTFTSFAQTKSEAAEVKAQFAQKLRELSAEDRAVFQDEFRQLMDEAEQHNLLQRVSSNGVDSKIRVMACVQIQGGIVLVAGQGLKCVNSDGDIFTMQSFGAFELTAGIAGGVATGYHYGPARNGNYGVKLGAGLHVLLGGSVLITGPYRILNVGAGAGLQAKWGVPRDSMFGGQIHVTVGE
ncbi:MAG: hypothetical protein KF767_17950 [Bdellovibrionaceae bacterium]|nr:hypothetical protein [Pseudobdellovibrionaceae bacterium]